MLKWFTEMYVPSTVKRSFADLTMDELEEGRRLIDQEIENRKFEAYRIYTKINLADTCRDPDEIVITELGYKHKLEDAKQLANDYIKESFFRKDMVLEERKDGTYSATDFCSYGVTIIVEPINID